MHRGLGCSFLGGHELTAKAAEKVRMVMLKIPELPFSYYVVGGAVRDVLLGCLPKDIDFATPLRPEEVIAAAEAAGIRTFPKGAAFGVVSLLIDGKEYEVASFRTEWYGEDGHRPEGVQLGASLEEDLARRDFTINAMAMTPDGKLIDPFGGREDLACGIIRAVGDPAKRFAEDALRLFRACRFAARYGFRIEEQTLAAMPGAVHRVAGVSVERVRDELEKILLAPYPSVGLRYLAECGLLSATCRVRDNGQDRLIAVLPELEHLKGLPQNPRHHRYDAWEHTLAVVDGVSAEPALRWAALLHDVAKGLPGVRCLNRYGELADHGHDRVGAEIAGEILARLRVQPDVARRAVWLVREHMSVPGIADEPSVRKWLTRLSGDFRTKQAMKDGVGQLLALRRADIEAGKVDLNFGQLDTLAGLVKQIFGNTPFFVTDLAVSGKDAVAVGFAGKDVGHVLNVLLERVRNRELPNKRTDLLYALQKRAQRMEQKQKTERKTEEKNVVDALVNHSRVNSGGLRW